MKPRLLALILLTATLPALTQGTRLWTVSRYDEMERGTADNVAIRSDGRLEAGPATSLLSTTGGSYVWAIATDAQGNAFAGQGGTAANAAVVTKVTPDGKSTKIFEGKELGVQAVHLGPDNAIYAATSPDGKVYRLGATPGDAKVIFDPSLTDEKPKYLWDIAAANGTLFVAAGAPAVVYRVPLNGGKPEIAFRTTDQHIRCLLLTRDGILWAGTDGGGVLYRLDTKIPGAKPFAVYAAPKREITALAADPAGNIYAAAVGVKTPGPSGFGPGLGPLPVTGAVGVTITFAQPGSANANTNTLIPDGSDIYRIAPDGSPSKLLTLKDDVVYALAFANGNLMAATGNRGRIYRVDTAAPGRFTDIAHLEAAQGMAFAVAPGGLLVGTSNSGKLFRLADTPAAKSTYTSEVFDAQSFAQWGRAELRTGSLAGLSIRTGNVESPLMGWSDWTPISNTGDVKIPGGRYVQWRAELHPNAPIESVALNYLQKNIAPVVDDIAVQTGARVNANPVPPNNAVPIAFAAPAAAASAPVYPPDPGATPLLAIKDRTAVTIRWSAHDDNGDDLMFAVFYRGIGESNWRLLKDKISDRFLSFDSSFLPDGIYEMRVLASDAPVHTDAETLTAERISGPFLVDTTPPVPGPLTATLVPGPPARIHATFDARDATSPIAHAEYSLDAGPWQYLEPVGQVSDSLAEHYDFTAPIPPATTPVADPREHLLAIRVYDRSENVVTAKTVVR